MTIDVDLVVAGAGGGLTAAVRAAELGLDVLVVDPDPNFRRAIADFLEREREAVAADRDYLGEMTPFRRGGS